MDKIEKKIKDLLLKLPVAGDALGFYLPVQKSGKTLYVSGQLPLIDGSLVSYRGRLGREITLENGQRAAKVALLNALAQIKKEIGSLDKIKKILRLVAYVSTFPGFREQHKVVDGASELLLEIFGDAGKHARSSVGVSDLPLGACVEIELTLEIM